MRSVPNSFQSILKSSLLFIFCFLFHTVSGQISYGGKPLPLHAGIGARSVGPAADLFVEMPSFDEKAALRQAQQDQTDFKSLEFAHKFHTLLRPDNSGITFVSGNMKVWRVGIRSKGASSLNILFSKFRLPPQAGLFVYSSDQSEILGSYTEKNNTELNLLPVQPVGGDELIVEYQEPLEATFNGEIEIGEVNHDFLGIFRATEPRDPAQNCHPNLVCYPEDIQPGSGVVGLIINGTTYCTGVLVNNTAEDATPYLLTATHCLNSNYNASFLANRKYDLIAGSIVAFFNYNSPLCDMDIRGPLQMTMASADSVLISERHDISLLKLKEAPPAEYQPYYLGWNAGSSPSAPFHGLHHPNGGIKKVAIDEGPLSLGSFDLPNYNLEEPNSFWEVRAWDTGATEGGSSGSPLLDREKRVLGTLTGGQSMCSSPRGPDSYASLFKFWNVPESLDNPNSINYYLDPEGSQALQIVGFNPHAQEPFTKSHNFKSDDKAVKYHFQSVPLFSTNNTFGYTEFAEQFYARTNVQLRGVFFSSPAVSGISDMNIRIRIYAGENGPERLLYEQPYNYSYRYYFSNSDFPDAPRNMNYNVENYIEFDEPVTVSGSFYISYYDMNGVPSGFSAFNAEPRKIGSGIISTAWMKNGSEWVRSSENIENPVNTALLIAPYVMGNSSTSVESEKEQPKLVVYHSNEVKRIFIESNYELIEWEIFYSSGIKIHHETADVSINRASYSSAHLPKGVYIVRVKTADGTVAAKKVVVI
ncbi:trypsin-like peptidase domain-containing protein [uncultured Proteiniphilum sp.]|uniref:trypsin-like peptidase domain-containing protein n=1 Tax=uncultured Proteiniphilum sp. TaxID=497637 RepID=UPI0026390344|nr:trypsin-like peptidase domain-containing protein [uncultured Proteiniphilum sp.]